MDAFARLKKAVGYLKDIGKVHKQLDIVVAMDMKQPHVSSFLNGKKDYFTEGNLKRFARAYSDYISEEWLLTGKGEMEVPDKSLKPHFEALSRAGRIGDESEGETGTPTDPRLFLPEYDFTIFAEGDSMLPKIESGDVLLCQWLTDRANPPTGEICVIDTINGSVVKEVSEITESSIRVHSLNENYSDYTIDISEIIRIAMVKGIIRKQ